MQVKNAPLIGCEAAIEIARQRVIKVNQATTGREVDDFKRLFRIEEPWVISEDGDRPYYIIFIDAPYYSMRFRIDAVTGKITGETEEEALSRASDYVHAMHFHIDAITDKVVWEAGTSPADESGPSTISAIRGGVSGLGVDGTKDSSILRRLFRTIFHTPIFPLPEEKIEANLPLIGREAAIEIARQYAMQKGWKKKDLQKTFWINGPLKAPALTDRSGNPFYTICPYPFWREDGPSFEIDAVAGEVLSEYPLVKEKIETNIPLIGREAAIETARQRAIQKGWEANDLQKTDCLNEPLDISIDGCHPYYIVHTNPQRLGNGFYFHIDAITGEILLEQPPLLARSNMLQDTASSSLIGREAAIEIARQRAIQRRSWSGEGLQAFGCLEEPRGRRSYYAIVANPNCIPYGARFHIDGMTGEILSEYPPLPR